MAQPEKMAQIGKAEILSLTTMTLPPYTATNTVLYGNRSFVVIDPGTKKEDQRAILATRIRERLDRGDQIKGICLTHHHGDHTGCAEWLREHFKAPIIAHQTAIGQVRFDIDILVSHPYEISLDQDATLIALHSPGHARDHLVFYDEHDQVLIAGDMITDKGTILVPPISGSLSIYLESLQLLTTLAIKTLVPAHGEVITDEPQQFLLKAMRHRYERIRAVLETLIAHSSKPLDATDITVLVYRGNISDDLLTFAQLSVESILRYLHERKLVCNIDHKWQAAPNAHELKRTTLLDAVKQINERLGNA